VDFLKGVINFFRFDKTNWRAVVLCLIAATVFWFFNALNKEHTATISYPVQFQYNAGAFIPAKSLPNKVLLNITGSGWDLLRKSLGYKTFPIQIQVDRPTEIKKIPPAAVLALAAAQLGQTRINHVASDTLMLAIEPRKSKKVKLTISRSQLRFELGFGLSSPVVILPNSIVVEGPASVITKVPDSILLPFPPGRISSNVKEEIEISPDVETVTMTPTSATVMFEVSELTDVSKKIKVVVLPAVPFRHQVSDDSIIVKLRMPANLRSGSDTIGLFAIIDLRELEAGVTKTVPAVKGLPPFAEIIFADSITVRKY
jgi:hypothetical protein